MQNIIETLQYKTVSENVVGEVRLNSETGHHSFHSKKFFKPGDVIAPFGARETLHQPTYLTVQINETEHILLAPIYLQYINHSCDPNVFFDTTIMKLVCIKPLGPGDELCFFYPSTEWHMSQPFVCNCKSGNCLQLISGADSIDGEVLKNYKVSAFIENKLKEKRAKRA